MDYLFRNLLARLPSRTDVGYRAHKDVLKAVERIPSLLHIVLANMEYKNFGSLSKYWSSQAIWLVERARLERGIRIGFRILSEQQVEPWLF